MEFPALHPDDIHEIFGLDAEKIGRAEKEIPEKFGINWAFDSIYGDQGFYFAAIQRYINTGSIYKKSDS